MSRKRKVKTTVLNALTLHIHKASSLIYMDIVCLLILQRKKIYEKLNIKSLDDQTNLDELNR